MIKNLIQKISKWREKRRFTVRCDKCGKKYHTREQAGICPHIEIKRFFSAFDGAWRDGDYSARVEGYETMDGQIVIANVETWKSISATFTENYAETLRKEIDRQAKNLTSKEPDWNLGDKDDFTKTK